MLDKFLAVAYSGEQKKTAARQLVDKLKTYPLEELKKLASGDPNCKLAYADACGGSRDDTWLGKYMGTPLFAKAVELEKSLVQLDMEDQKMRAEERAVRPDPSDTWMRRDAIQLQKRMLDLDLVMAQNGGDPTEAAAPAEAMPAEVGGAPPAAPKEEKAPAPEAPAAAGGGEGGEPSEEEVLQALEAEAGGAPAEGAPPQQQPPKPKAPPQQAQGGEGEEEEDEEDEEGQPPKKDKPKGMSVEVKQSSAKTAAAAAVSAGALFAKFASHTNADSKVRREVAKKFPQLAKEKTAQMPPLAGNSYLPEILGAAAGANKGSEQGRPGSGALRGAIGAGVGSVAGEQLGRALSKEHPAAGLLGAGLGGLAGYKMLTHKYSQPPAKAGGETIDPGVPEFGGESVEGVRQLAASDRATADDMDSNPNKYRLRRALLGGALGAGAGALAGGGLKRLSPAGALVGGLGAAALSAVPRPSGAGHRAAADEAEQVAQAHEAKKVANVLGALGGAATAAKGLASSAMGAGGLPQVAKSFGNVAKGFAQKNPLAAAGIAGAGGLMAGRALSPSQPRA